MAETELIELDDTGAKLKTYTMETDDPDSNEIWKYMLIGRVCRYEAEQVEVPVTYWYDTGWWKAWAEQNPDKTVTIWRFTVTEPDNEQRGIHGRQRTSGGKQP